MKKLRILVVEDERIVALDMEMFLTDMGHEITGVAATAEEAIRKAEETVPDVLLMDIMLDGEMDGIEAAEVIRRRFSIPVIYVTAHADKETRERAESTKPLAYLIKPVRAFELCMALDHTLFPAVNIVEPSRYASDARSK